MKNLSNSSAFAKEMTENEGKIREPLWAINPNWRGWFYGVLSICGVAVFVFTLVDEWSKVVAVLTLAAEWIKNCLAIFDVLWERVFGSAVLVWFSFQVTEAAMGAYQYFMGLKEARRLEAEARVKEAEARVKAAKEKVRQEAAEKARQEERDSLRKYIETVRREKTFSAEELQRVLKLMEDWEKNRKD